MVDLPPWEGSRMEASAIQCCGCCDSHHKSSLTEHRVTIRVVRNREWMVHLHRPTNAMAVALAQCLAIWNHQAAPPVCFRGIQHLRSRRWHLARLRCLAFDDKHFSACTVASAPAASIFYANMQPQCNARRWRVASFNAPLAAAPLAALIHHKVAVCSFDIAQNDKERERKELRNEFV